MGSRILSRRSSNCLQKENWRGRRVNTYTRKHAFPAYLFTGLPLYFYMARILVIGASGLLGINLAMEAMREHEVIGVDRGKLKSAPFQVIQADLTQSTVMDSVIDIIRPDWLINCAALANLEKCEED